MPTVKVLGVPVYYRSSGSMPKGCMIPWYLFWAMLTLVSFGLGAANFVQEETWFAHAVPATGTITGYDMHVRNDGKVDFCQRIEYTTQAGQSATSHGDCGTQDESQIGKTVSLYYDPNKPSDTRTKGWFNDEGSGLIFGLIMGVFFSMFIWVPFVTPWLGKLARETKIIVPDTPDYGAASASGDWATPNYGVGKSILRQDAERYHANQRAAERRDHQQAAQHQGGQPPATPSAMQSSADEARLAELKRQEAELQRKIDEQRRQQGQ